MPQHIRAIPYAELVKDLGESLVDIGLCETALSLGVTREDLRKSPEPAERKAKNEEFVRVVVEELKRRGRDLEGPFPMTPTPLEGP